jgi:hypothetical protein
MWSCSTFYFESRQAIGLRSSSCRKQGNISTTTTQFQANPYSYSCHWRCNGQIFLGLFQCKSDVIKCAILWNLWEFRATSFCSDGCVILWNFKSLKQFHGGVMSGYAKPSVNNIIDIEKEPTKGVEVNSNNLKRGWLSYSHFMVSKIYFWMIGLLLRGNCHYQQRKCNQYFHPLIK